MFVIYEHVIITFSMLNAREQVKLNRRHTKNTIIILLFLWYDFRKCNFISLTLCVQRRFPLTIWVTFHACLPILLSVFSPHRIFTSSSNTNSRIHSVSQNDRISSHGFQLLVKDAKEKHRQIARHYNSKQTPSVAGRYPFIFSDIHKTECNRILPFIS